MGGQRKVNEHDRVDTAFCSKDFHTCHVVCIILRPQGQIILAWKKQRASRKFRHLHTAKWEKNSLFCTQKIEFHVLVVSQLEGCVKNFLKHNLGSFWGWFGSCHKNNNKYSMTRVTCQQHMSNMIRTYQFRKRPIDRLPDRLSRLESYQHKH